MIPEGGSKVSDQVAAAFSLAGVVGVGSCGGVAVGKEKPHNPPWGRKWFLLIKLGSGKGLKGLGVLVV